MAHKDRQAAAQVLGVELRAPVYIDFTDDRNAAAERRNGDIAWRDGQGGDWTVVLQDDALPVEGFREQVSAALAHAPQTAVGLYFGGGRPEGGLTSWAAQRADGFDAAWIEWHKLAWGVGVAMPTAAVEDFLAWARNQAQRYDRRISEFWQMRRAPVRYTWPSLVDHDDELPTIAQRRPAGVARRAYRVGKRDSWDGPVMRIGARRS
jgi:hypothetical protein